MRRRRQARKLITMVSDQMQAWLSSSMHYGLISLLSVFVAGVVGLSGFAFARRRRNK